MQEKIQKLWCASVEVEGIAASMMMRKADQRYIDRCLPLLQSKIDEIKVLADSLNVTEGVHEIPAVVETETESLEQAENTEITDEIDEAEEIEEVEGVSSPQTEEIEEIEKLSSPEAESPVLELPEPEVEEPVEDESENEVTFKPETEEGTESEDVLETEDVPESDAPNPDAHPEVKSEPIELPEPTPVEEPELEPVEEPEPEPIPHPEPEPIEHPEPEPETVAEPEVKSVIEPKSHSEAELAPSTLSLDEKLSRKISKNFRQAISLNDKFRFRRELFGNSSQQYDAALDLIAEMSSFEEARDYFLDSYGWDAENPDVKSFFAILSNHYSN